MGIKRIVDTAFWTDGKVDDFTPEDKYFMLYLLTNPFTTQLGIYELSIRQAAFHLGYSKEAFRALLERFQNKYGVIIYSEDTNEVAIKNFLRHSIIKGGAPVRDCLIKELKKVKNRDLIAFVFSHIKQYENLNETVKKIIDEYEEKNGELSYSNEKDIENDALPTHTPTNPQPAVRAKKPDKAEIDAFFESIWKLYPEKKGKGQVSQSKRAALYEIGFDEISRAVERYLKELEKDASWRKPQNGSTFFNSGYVDYLDANYSPSQPVQQKAAAKSNGWNSMMSGYSESTFDEIERRRMESLMAEKKANEDP